MTGPLDGVRVVDAATMLAGPLAAQILGDHGAEVIKIEHPTRPDSLRDHPPKVNGQSLWWKQVARNKRSIAIDFSKEEGATLLLDLLRDVRCADRELSYGNIRSLGSRVGPVEGCEPESHRPKGYGLRSDRTLCQASWVRNDRRGDEWIFGHHRIPRGATVAATVRAGRLPGWRHRCGSGCHGAIPPRCERR